MEPEREQDHPHEEAIVPVRPGLASAPGRAQEGASRDGVSEPARRRISPPVVAGIGGFVLLVAALGVFFLLPGWVERRAAQSAPAEPAAPAVVEQAEPERPELTEEQIAALRDEADTLLGRLLTQQQGLSAASADAWGGEDWQRYEALSRSGDDAYLAHDYQAAIDTYSEALDVGDALLERSADITRDALDAGQRALEAGNSRLAIEQFDLVLSVDAENEAALAGRARAERLPEVLELMRQADALRQQQNLSDAAEAYRAALDIDGEWTAARRALDAVEQAIANARFDALMSDGYRALSDERYEEADGHFRAALAMRPGAAEARDGILQAEQGLLLDQIALTEARALAFERRELWGQAVQQYRAALETDDSLEFARSGLDRAQRRADLDAKLANLIENPNLLFGDDVLGSARALVDEANAVAAAGESPAGDDNPRLKEQIEDLNRLIALATTPVTVDLVSDGITEVTLYRVGQLGTFDAKEVELRPGNYTALGSRRGYRDVRRTFTVLPGRELEPISVICVEPI